MLTRNDFLYFDDKQVKEVEDMLSNFKAILKKMGIDVETGIFLTSSKEVMQTFYTINGEKKAQYYRKSITAPWNHTLYSIAAGLFNEIVILGLPNE